MILSASKMSSSMAFTVVLVAILQLHQHAVVAQENNMNQGDYKIANSETFATDYHNHEYFEFYSKPIETVYSQVHWISHGNMPLPQEIVDRFANGKLMAITGYEVDQVRIDEASGEEVSVPITWAYNHHYVTYVLNSKKARLVKKKTTEEMKKRGFHHGMDEYLGAEMLSEEPDNEIPQVHMFSEGNGGEFRLSYHGYPNGYAQIIESPDSYNIAPMQIDTWNRNATNSTYLPGPMPSGSRIPPEAGYSGLLECPCTDRIEFKWGMTYGFDGGGGANDNNDYYCSGPVPNATNCHEAVQYVVKGKEYRSSQVSTDSMPKGCSATLREDGSVDIVWNELPTSNNVLDYQRLALVEESSNRLAGVALGLVNLTLSIDLDAKEENDQAVVHMTLTGPADKWFGVGFGSFYMCVHQQGDECPDGGPYAIIVSGDEVVERKLDFHGPGVVIEKSLTIESNLVEDGWRTVHLSRALKGKTSKHYTFTTSSSSSHKLIMANGCNLEFGKHCGHEPNELNILQVDSPMKICQSGVEGTINKSHMSSDRCAPFPESDLVWQKNPTCRVETYVGGIHCCSHNNILLDKDQEIPWKDQPLVYRLKFRVYFEEYRHQDDAEDNGNDNAATTTPTNTNNDKKASHKQLIRPYWQTERRAGEYDVVQCPTGTPADECVHTITARWKVRDMMVDCPIQDASWCTGVGSTNSSVTKGIELIYIGPHCHAPACLSMELINSDTGQTICKTEPSLGEGTGQKYDEHQYLAIPPCLFGDPKDGLLEPELLTLDTNLLAIKRNNSTLPHTGEMASWQMRGIVVPREEAETLDTK
ncbi:unnamed protein product [Cylindrotheca closterium]|uniref:Uncharacterized protein n=1 Tax=Cylindrotheca closterium TaxID=2856 RepID=A0AAD2CBQ6_9STRA|nr:unnamed protein product [Cylindrotheca closterium]